MIRPVFIAVLAVAALAACQPVDTAMRNAPGAEAISAPAVAEALAVESYSVTVPDRLSVSEANVLVPATDIVWRGDPPGDRRRQVKAIFETALAAPGLSTGRPVHVAIEVLRFHGLTEKARRMTGGNYAMWFRVTVTDAGTGAVLDGPRVVHADLRDFGPSRSVAEERAGTTEKMLVTDHLIRTISAELHHTPV